MIAPPARVWRRRNQATKFCRSFATDRKKRSGSGGSAPNAFGGDAKINAASPPNLTSGSPQDESVRLADKGLLDPPSRRRAKRLQFRDVTHGNVPNTSREKVS